MLTLICEGIILTASVAAYIYLKRKELKKTIKIFICAGALIFNAISVFILTVLNTFALPYSMMILAGVNILIALSVFDMETMELPRLLLYPFIALGVLTVFFIPGAVFWQVMLFAVVVAGILWLVSMKVKNGFGSGDVKIIFCIMLMFNIGKSVSILFLSLLLSLVFGLPYILIKKGNIKMELPFAPFVLISVMINLCITNI